MKDQQRNVMVAVFVLVGLAALGWLVFKFQDLPTFFSHYDAKEINIYFPHAHGIQQNTDIFFRGYPVGRVVQVKPPALLPDLDDPTKEYHQIIIVVALTNEIPIPANIVPKVFRRGLGGSYIELCLEEDPAEENLTDGTNLHGHLSEASEFISEKTQKQMDELISSLMRLSDTMQIQFEPLPPEHLDAAPPGTRPNLTTVIMRLDTALKNLNVALGDPDNQHNFKQGLADFAALSAELRDVVSESTVVAQEALKLIEQVSSAVTHLDTTAGQAGDAFLQVAAKAQDVSDDLAIVLRHFDDILSQIAAGEGTAGRILRDPRLYESLTDASENLSLAVADLRTLIARWSESGLKIKLK